MHVPPPLQPGDKVYLLSTARAVSPEQAQQFVQAIAAAGYVPVSGKTLSACENIFAGDDNLRRGDLQQALADDSVRAIWCARGGYGTTRILDGIDWSGLLRAPKWIVGYSDATALLAQSVRLGVVAIHGPMGIHCADAEGAIAWQQTLNCLAGSPPTYTWQCASDNVQGTAVGTLIGGNLSLLGHLSGSPGEYPWTDSLLFIEDVDEYLYHIDRLLVQLERSGKLRHVQGVICGDFKDMKDNPEPFGRSLQEIILRAFAPYKIPVSFGFSAGHLPHNLPLLMGSQVQLQVTAERCSLRFQP